MEIVIVEKKKDTVDPSKVRIPMNYVLVHPDPHHEFFHDKEGKEMDIMVGKSLMVDKADDDDIVGRLEESVTTISQHYSVRGRVYAVPNRLSFPRKEIKKLRANFGNNDSDMKRLGEVVRNCLEWDVDMEVNVGDEVIFDYLAHIGCYEDGRWVETDMGDMLLIKYDELHMVIRPRDEKSMLNGWMLIKRKEKPDRTESGVELFYKNKDDISKYAEGSVILPGSGVRGYKGDLDMSDEQESFDEGDKIIYRPGGSRPLEWVLHQTLFPDQKALLIHRKDILCKIDNG